MPSASLANSADLTTADLDDVGGTRTRFDSQHLMHAAEKQARLSDWGDDLSFMEGLEQLVAGVEAMGAAARLRPVVAQHVLRLLTTRLELVADAHRYPDILTRKIERPLIVVGMPRTGTTWLYELLALDPAARAPLDWEVQRPSPPPEAASFDVDPRIAEVEAINRGIVTGAPELATMTNFGSQLPQECNAINTLHFASPNFWSVYSVPRYLEWLTSARPQGVLKTHQRVLKQLQWHGPSGRWTLKSPSYLMMLEELFETYPDACLIQTHREPARIVASVSNLVRSRRRARFEDVAEMMDPEAIAASALGHFGTCLERGAESRRDPQIDARCIDVAYRDLVHDPLPELRRIYAHFDLPFSREYEERVAAHIASPRQTGHGQHKYDAAEFGVSKLDIASRFAAYRARFGHLLADA